MAPRCHMAIPAPSLVVAVLSAALPELIDVRGIQGAVQ
jgi:hypothetical protein